MTTEGERRRDAGMERVIAHTPEDYRVLCRRAIGALAVRGDEFTADDVVDMAGMPPAGLSHNIIGAMVNGEARRGMIVAVGFVQSNRASRQAGVQRIWRGKAWAA